MIPKIIHQTWKSSEVPRALRFFQQTWRAHHPDWEYRLWTDNDNRDFLARYYPWFLPVFDGYLAPICRADAIRYFLLRHFGGVYVDLDFECLAPLDSFLVGHHAMLGLEPVRHHEQYGNRLDDVQRLACNALMASKPGHVFWDHVIDYMVREQANPGPLDATGPFLLSRALESYPGPDPVTVTGSETFYPITSDESIAGRLFDLDFWNKVTTHARAIHHWAGTWYRDRQEGTPSPVAEAPIQVTDQGRHVLAGAVKLGRKPSVDEGRPLVSCLMITRNRALLAMRAVRCFQEQTWTNRELIVLDEGPDGALGMQLAALNDPRIRHVARRPDGSSLGTLRNVAVGLARGQYVCQWDDDDLYDPARIELQMGALREARADACLLSRWTIWWPDQRRFALSCHRPWEGSLLCASERMPSCPDRASGEDTPVVQELLRDARVALLDVPRLYLYVVHGGNTFGATHFTSHWERATLQIAGDAYVRALQEIRKRLDLSAYLAAWNGAMSGSAEATSPVSCEPEPRVAPAEAAELVAKPVQAAREPRLPERRRAVALPGKLPSVLVLTPVKDAEIHLPDFLEQIEALDYPSDRLALGFLEGNSTDRSHDWLQGHREAFARRARRHVILRRDHGYRLSGDRSAAEGQYRRRRAIALCRNELFHTSYAGEDYVLWIDADVTHYPSDILHTLLAQRRDVVVPHCVLDPGGPSFDLNTFVHERDQSLWEWHHVRESIIQPPRGDGRRYLDRFRGRESVPVDSVGGTMLLVAAPIHVGGVLFPPYSYRGYIETEGFAMLARDRGVRCWGLPDVEIIHARR